MDKFRKRCLVGGIKKYRKEEEEEEEKKKENWIRAWFGQKHAKKSHTHARADREEKSEVKARPRRKKGIKIYLQTFWMRPRTYSTNTHMYRERERNKKKRSKRRKKNTPASERRGFCACSSSKKEKYFMHTQTQVVAKKGRRDNEKGKKNPVRQEWERGGEGVYIDKEVGR